MWVPHLRVCHCPGTGHWWLHLGKLQFHTEFISQLYKDAWLPTSPNPWYIKSLHHLHVTSHQTRFGGNGPVRYLPPTRTLFPWHPQLVQLCSGTLYIAGLQEDAGSSHHTQTALTIGDLETVVDMLSSSADYDDHLFLAWLLMGFFVLFQLGEMTYPNDPELQDLRKVTKHNSVQMVEMRALQKGGFHLTPQLAVQI